MAPALHVIAGPGPGQLATMAHPRDEPWSPQELGALARAGVHVLVSCSGTGPDTAGIEVVPFPASAPPVAAEENRPRPDARAAPELRQEANAVVALAVRLAREVRAGRFVVTQAAADNGRSTLLATMTLALLGIRPGEALRRTGPDGDTVIAPDWLHEFVATHG